MRGKTGCWVFPLTAQAIKGGNLVSIKSLFENEQAGFTVYSPDCTQSRLWGNLDHAIHDSTGFEPVYRQWIYHDYNSLIRFYTAGDQSEPAYQDPQEAARRYDNVAAEDLRYGHLVGMLLLSGPSLLTVWRGDKAIPTLLELKGKTHPPEASPKSIRGRFWCDNGVCNLLHVSDNYAEAKRELGVVKVWDSLGEIDPNPMSLIDPIPAPTRYVAHSGISVACDVINRMLMGIPSARGLNIQLPPSGDSKETNTMLTAVLQEAAQQLPDSTVAEFSRAYLAEDVITVTNMLKHMPVTKWEHFIIQCGAITRGKWDTIPTP